MASKFLEFNLSPLNNPFSFSDQCNFNLFFSSTSLFWSCQSRILLSSNNIISQNSTSWIFTNEIWNFICTWKNSTIEFTISCYMVLLLVSLTASHSCKAQNPNSWGLKRFLSFATSPISFLTFSISFNR